MKKLPTLGSFLTLRIFTRIVQNPKKLPTLADFFDELIFHQEYTFTDTISDLAALTGYTFPYT